MRAIVGRTEYLETFQELYKSDKSEFVAVYGRRRVGKTFLIRTAFEGKFTFQVTGLSNASMTQQITNFNLALRKVVPEPDYTVAKDWFSAFQQLIAFLESKGEEKKIIFIDELPWFDTPKSGFISALEHFWNSWAAMRNDILLVVCGSAASWMINKLINNKGGFHNRVTKRMKIVPFTLHECERFLETRNTQLDRYQIIQLYMVLGGIPFYWDEVKPGKSAVQNIEEICFGESGILRSEFKNLYKSLFNKHEKHSAIVNALAQKSMGLTRDEIISETGLPNAGSTSRMLDELEESGFILKYNPFGKKSRNSIYQLVDFYSLFYLKFIAETHSKDTNQWINLNDSPKQRAWSGYAFEQVCLAHLPQIKKALGISGIHSTSSAWRSSTVKNGAQVDLVIDRRDQVVNLCEMKFSINNFVIDAKYAEELRNKIGIFKTETKTRKSVFLTMITTYGLQQNTYSTGLVQNSITMDPLFEA
jgi:AAA+ ATPase superfamily predicted ATPase